MKKLNLQKTILVLGIIAVFGVVFYNTKDLFFGAPLSISTVSDGTTVTDSFLPISGSARHALSIQINGRIVSIDKSGSFTDGVVLSPGYNIIEIVQQDRFGKEKHKVFHLVAEPTSSVATNVRVHYQ
jgi:hypothetical protein